eukprot:scaffold15406_cov119-Isochrysis_galbana.AAC.11
MGDPALYPEVRTARFLYAMQWLPPDCRADYQARQQWIDNNLTYLDGLAIAEFHYNDADFRRDTWSVYHDLHISFPIRISSPLVPSQRLLRSFKCATPR